MLSIEQKQEIADNPLTIEAVFILVDGLLAQKAKAVLGLSAEDDKRLVLEKARYEGMAAVATELKKAITAVKRS